MGLRQQLRATAIDAYLGEQAVRLRRRFYGLGKAAKLELYFQVDDPYSYLLGQTVATILEVSGLNLEVILVPPPPPEFDSEPALRKQNALRDAVELAADYELTFPVSPRQPSAAFVERANAVLARERPAKRQLALALCVAQALWDGDEAVLTNIETQEGSAPPHEVLARNDRLRRRRGHYLGGMLRYGGVWYWGVDRLRHLRRHLTEIGHPGPALLVPRERLLVGEWPNELTMYHSFRSPYSYVAAHRAAALCERHDIALKVRPVLPMVMRGHTVPLIKRLYIARDTAREARLFGVPFGRLCDPLGPGIERCLAVFYRARELGREVDFMLSAGRGVWSEALDVGVDDDMRRICERAGISWSAASDAINGNVWQAETEANRKALYALGLWGVPTFELGSFAVWGNDRLDMIARRLEARPRSQA